MDQNCFETLLEHLVHHFVSKQVSLHHIVYLFFYVTPTRTAEQKQVCFSEVHLLLLHIPLPEGNCD